MGARIRYSTGKMGMVLNGTPPRAGISSRGMRRERIQRCALVGVDVGEIAPRRKYLPVSFVPRI